MPYAQLLFINKTEVHLVDLTTSNNATLKHPSLLEMISYPFLISFTAPAK